MCNNGKRRIAKWMNQSDSQNKVLRQLMQKAGLTRLLLSPGLYFTRLMAGLSNSGLYTKVITVRIGTVITS